VVKIENVQNLNNKAVVDQALQISGGNPDQIFFDDDFLMNILNHKAVDSTGFDITADEPADAAINAGGNMKTEIQAVDFPAIKTEIIDQEFSLFPEGSNPSDAVPSSSPSATVSLGDKTTVGPADASSGASTSVDGAPHEAQDSDEHSEGSRKRSHTTNEDRLMRNRASAQLSRKRKKMYLDNLEKDCKEMKERNAKLLASIEAIDSENQLLRTELQDLRSVITQAASFSGVNRAVLASSFSTGVAPQ